MTLLRQAVLATLATLMLSFCACKGDSGVTGPNPKSGIVGIWTGDASDSSGPGRMTWEIDHDVSPFLGALIVTDLHSGFGGKGVVSGNVTGTTLSFTLKVQPPQGFEPPFENCTAEMAGEGQLSSTLITGTYTGTSSCDGPITAGQFTLTRE